MVSCVPIVVTVRTCPKRLVWHGRESLRRRLRRMGLLSCAVLVAICALSACSAVQFVSDGESDHALLEVDCNPPDATVVIDETTLGLVSDRLGGTFPVRPGKHQVEVVRDGYYPYRFDLEAKPGRSYRLALDLVPDLDQVDESLESEGRR